MVKGATKNPCKSSNGVFKMHSIIIQMTRTTNDIISHMHALGDWCVKHICKIVQQFNSNSTLWCLLSTSHAIIPYFRKISFQRFQGLQDDLQIGAQPSRPQAASLWFPTGMPFSLQGRYICNNYYLISDILHIMLSVAFWSAESLRSG